VAIDTSICNWGYAAEAAYCDRRKDNTTSTSDPVLVSPELVLLFVYIKSVKNISFHRERKSFLAGISRRLHFGRKSQPAIRQGTAGWRL
jgi:hypothetical protein